MNYDWFLWEIAKSRGRKLLKIAIKSFLKLQDSWNLGTYFDASNIIITILKCTRWSASNCYNNDDVWSIETCSSNSKASLLLLLFFFVNNCNTCAIMTNTDQINWTTLLHRADLSSIDQRFFAQAYYVIVDHREPVKRSIRNSNPISVNVKKDTLPQQVDFPDLRYDSFPYFVSTSAVIWRNVLRNSISALFRVC